LSREKYDSAKKTFARQAAAHSGFKNKDYDGIKKVLRGLTTFNELSGIMA
jgi:hypothetical protein